MGVFSEIAMEQQNSMFDSSAAFEDDEAFELEEMESLPVPPVGTDTVPVSAASVSAGETALADAEEEPADEVAPAGEEKSAEEGNSAQPPAAEDEEKKRAEYEAAEAQRKAEFDAKQQAKKAAEQEQIARLEAMSDEEVIAASTQRVSTDVEKLTRRNMKECVSEHIQMLCMEDTAFARLTMHPKKNMIRCFQYINRKAWDYVQDELKASGTRPGPGQQTYAEEEYMVVAPENIFAIIKEGRMLHHCVGNDGSGERYYERMERRESFILFLRRTDEPEDPYYTLEIEPDGTVRQKRTLFDRQHEDIEQATDFLRRWQKVIAERLTGRDLKLAAESRILREKEFIQLKKDRVIIHTGHLAGRLLADVLMADLMENTDSIQSPALAAAA